MSILSRFVRPIRVGVVTSGYPDAAPALQPATRQLPVVEAARCTRDSACVRVCPTGAIALSADRWTVDAGKCIFCGACERACPAEAIGMTGGVTLAATTAAGLLHDTRLSGEQGS